MDKKSKEEILHIDQEDRKILDTMRKRTRKWLGHVLRHSGVLHDVSAERLLRKKGQKTDKDGRRLDDDDDDDERMNFNVVLVLRLQGHVTRRNNSEVTW